MSHEKEEAGEGRSVGEVKRKSGSDAGLRAASKTEVELVSAALAEDINRATATNRIPFVNWPIVTMI